MSERIDRFIQHGTEFLDALAQVPEQQRDVAPGGDEWSTGFVVHHMADSELHISSRYLHALAEDTPPILPFNEELLSLIHI